PRRLDRGLRPPRRAGPQPGLTARPERTAAANVMSSRRRGVLAVVGVVLALVAMSMASARGGPAIGGGEREGDLQFPQDEHEHPDGWDYWWGAADLVTTAGNRYTVGLAFDAVYGYAADGHQV